MFDTLLVCRESRVRNHRQTKGKSDQDQPTAPIKGIETSQRHHRPDLYRHLLYRYGRDAARRSDNRNDQLCTSAEPSRYDRLAGTHLTDSLDLPDLRRRLDLHDDGLQRSLSQFNDR